MINSLKQLLNRFNARPYRYALLFLGLPSLALATASIDSVSVSTANPEPGSLLGVTVVYCENQTYNNTYFYVALEPSAATTIQGCPIPDQILLVDGGNSAGPKSPLPPPEMMKATPVRVGTPEIHLQPPNAPSLKFLK